MAAVVKLCSRDILRRVLMSTRCTTLSFRQITTSKSSKEESTPVLCPPQVASPGVKDFRKPTKEWHSYGFDFKDEHEDIFNMHTFMFLIITCIFCGVPFFFCYLPDYKERSWSHREAFLRLREREAAGLPPVDRNYIDPALIELPDDEDLEGMEIIL